MLTFTYEVPNKVRMSTKIPIINEQGEPVFTLQKNQHRFFARIVHDTVRGGLPYCYKVNDMNGEFFYSIVCTFPGIRYQLTEQSSQQMIPITSHRVQLIEKAYSFLLNNHTYYFERDATNAGHLKCDNQQIATVYLPFDPDIWKKIDKIIVKATTKEIAALAAVLYHTFYYYDA